MDLQAYFARIGYQGPCRPDRTVLTELVEKHMAAIPFEAVDVLLGKGVDLSPSAIDRKMLQGRRGGYCFEHASLMRRVLEAIGFAVRQYLARMRLHAVPADPPRPATHTALRVTTEEGDWLVDTGFGGYLPNLPLRWHCSGLQATRFGKFRLSPTRDGLMLECFTEGQWLPLYEILDFHWQDTDFAVANHYTATSPDSLFRRKLVVTRIDGECRLTLLGNRLKTATADGLHTEYNLGAAELEDVLARTFGLPVAEEWRPLLELAVQGGTAV